MKAGWKNTKLKDVCELVNGRAYKKDELLAEGKYRVLRVGNFFTNDHWYFSDLELEDKKYCDKGDLLYAWSASFGPRVWSGEKVIFHYHIWKVLPNPNLIDQRFLFHFLMWDMDKIKEDQGAGTTMLHVSKGSMDEREISVPSIKEQQRIVVKLDQAFEGIAKVRATATQNLQNARALFESHLQSVFIQNGKGWKDRMLGEIAEVQSGGTPSVPRKDYWNGDIPWYSSGELNDIHTTHPDRKITKSGLSNSNAKLFPKGSLLVGMYDTAALKMSILDRDGAFNQAIAGVKPNDKIEVEYILHAINANKPMLLLERRGVRQKNLSLGKIKEILIPFPEPAEQRVVVSHLRTVMSETRRLESIYQRKLELLDELKKSLLQQAFSGEL